MPFDITSRIACINNALSLEAEFVVELYVFLLAKESYFGALSIPADPLQNLYYAFAETLSPD